MPPVFPIDVPATIKRLQEGAVLVDVLPETDYQSEHIPGAVNVPVERADFETRMARVVPDKGTPVIVYCTDGEGQAGSRAARRLEQMGYESVYHLREGIEGWKGVGHRVERGTARVRSRP